MSLAHNASFILLTKECKCCIVVPTLTILTFNNLHVHLSFSRTPVVRTRARTAGLAKQDLQIKDIDVCVRGSTVNTAKMVSLSLLVFIIIIIIITSETGKQYYIY